MASKHAPGSFCWFESGTRDAAKVKPFYTQVFGWKTFDAEMPGGAGTYTLFRNDAGEDIAGLYTLAGPMFEGVPAHWATYVAVENVDDSARRAAALGGKVAAEPMDIPGVGRIAFLVDPTGATIGIAHFDPHPGTSMQGPFGWSELATPDTARAAAFYTELFDWKAKPDKVNPYTEFQSGGRSIGGMMEPKQPGMPPCWTPYVMVDDCDQTAKRVTDNGGRLYVPPTDIENVGRFCVFADPGGAVLAFIQMRHH